MKNSIMRAAVITCAALAPIVGLAQEDDGPRPYVYATYFECDDSRQALADEIVDAAFAGAYDAAVEAGEIQSWGWLAHRTGSKWGRLFYHSAPDLDSLLAALGGDAEDEKYPEMVRAFGDICDSHMDYIWRFVTGFRPDNPLAVERGKTAFGAYYVCDMGREDRADEIVTDVFAPIYNAHVGEGKLESWGWMEHYLGGKLRRIWTLSAADHTTVLAERGAIYGELNESNEDALQEFHDICGSHQGMLWDIVKETP